MLHVHGGGQTASIEWVRFWARRGYAGVTFDFCGKLGGRADFTDWGPIKQGNMMDAAGGFQLRPTPRESSWFHWAAPSPARLSTLLAGHPQVDPDRLGVFGVSVGGTLSWLIAASDPRVKAAAPIYGCGYNYDRRNARWDILVANDEVQRTTSTCCRPRPTRFPLITCPILFLSTPNDGHGAARSHNDRCKGRPKARRIRRSRPAPSTTSSPARDATCRSGWTGTSREERASRSRPA